MLRFGSAATVFATMLVCAGTAHAGQVLNVDDGKARMVPAIRARAAALPSGQLKEYEAALADARRTRDVLPAGPGRDELAGVIANAEALEASGQLTLSRIPATLMILRRNTEFWIQPAAGARHPDRVHGLDQHSLLTDVLGILCRRQGSAVYCDHPARFAQYLALRSV